MANNYSKQQGFKRLLLVLSIFCILSCIHIVTAQKFAIPVFPDSQTEVMSRMDMFNSQMNWIVKHKDSLNIPFVLHVGDIVNYDNITHWQDASNGFGILDQANIPYAVCLGNHDTEAVGENSGSAAPGNTNLNLRKTSKFNTYFPVSRFTAQKGRYEEGKSDNAFYTFVAGGQKWMVLSLEFCARQAPLDWAESVVSLYPDHNVIVLTHYHLTPAGDISTSNAGYGDLSPSDIYNQFIKKHANIILVLSGHVSTTAKRMDTGDNGNQIYQILQDYQDIDAGGGYLRLLEIDTEMKTISAKMYSPFYNITKQDESMFNFTNVKFVADVVPINPLISLTSGATNQTVNTGLSVSNITYTYAGTATGISVAWSGTANSTTAPEGITATTDALAKTLTLSGKLNVAGTYGYNVTATDGTKTTSALTGTFTAKTTTKYKLAYVTTLTNGVPGALDAPYLTALGNENFDLNYISSTARAVDYSFYDLIILSAIPPSSDGGIVDLKTVSLSKPFINMKMFSLMASRWNWLSPYNNTTRNTITVPDSAKLHPIFNGISFTGTSNNEIQLTTATTGNMLVYAAWLTSSTASANPRVLATIQSIPTGYSYMEIPVGTKMNGMTIPTSAKQILLGLSEASWALVTPDAVKILVNAAKFVVTPPSVTLSGGNINQTVGEGIAITNITYSLGFSDKSVSISWKDGNGTTIPTPTGISVVSDLTNKLLTISGAPTSQGEFNYSVTATDGATITDNLNGKLTVTVSTGVNSSLNSKSIVSKEFYDITGKKVNEYARGILIEKLIYTDGSFIYHKIIRPEF